MRNKVFYRYLGCVIAAVVILALFYGFSEDLFESRSAADVIRVLSDGFAVSGVILAGTGALSWASSKGAYDMIYYGVGSMIRPFTSRRHEYESFYDFKLRKTEQRKPWLKECLITGILLLAVCAVLTGIFFLVDR